MPRLLSARSGDSSFLAPTAGDRRRPRTIIPSLAVTIIATFRFPAFLLTGAILAAALVSCSSIPRKTDAAGEKAYGAYMARRGFWSEALFRFERAAALRPGDAEIQNDLAVAYESLGKTAQALAAYKKALELAPSDSRIRRNYARFAEYYTAAQRPSGPPEAAHP